MKNWYITREASGLNHCGIDIAQDKKILLTEEQAILHGKKVENSQAPANRDEAGVISEWEEFEREMEELNTEKERTSHGEPYDGSPVSSSSDDGLIKEPEVTSAEETSAARDDRAVAEDLEPSDE